MPKRASRAKRSGSGRPPRRMPSTRLMPDRRQRQYTHVLESTLDKNLRKGMPFGTAWRLAREIAARTVNKFRAQRAAGRVLCAPDRRMKRGARALRCRIDRGPKLIGQGGPRRGWYPGKPVRREIYVCLKHGQRFKGKAALLAHYRSHRTTDDA